MSWFIWILMLLQFFLIGLLCIVCVIYSWDIILNIKWMRKRKIRLMKGGDK